MDSRSTHQHRIRCDQSRTYLEKTRVQNDLGQTFSLAELADKSTSNPKLRRAEMMTALSGYSKWAESQDHAALFITLTTPSRMHRCGTSSTRNPSYDGVSPAAAQQYLNEVWRRIRAQLSREDIKFYGLRVAEPHHDGTPHWHLLTFVQAPHYKRFCEILQHHALQDSPNEPGAAKHRLKIEPCDYSKGDPVGYMAKYISKNIDGFAVELDDLGQPMLDANQRIKAWASINRIRQFQFFGGPSFSIWRALRKLTSPLHNEYEEIRQAADRGDFATYIELMGGMNVPRITRPIEIKSFSEDLDPLTGEISSEAREELSDKVRRYLKMQDVLVPCSTMRWTVLPAPAAFSFQAPFISPGVARGDKGRLEQNRGDLGLVSITVRPNENKYLLPNQNQYDET
jgi:hypothetical protein